MLTPYQPAGCGPRGRPQIKENGIRSDDRPDGHEGRPCKRIINAHPLFADGINAHPLFADGHEGRPCKRTISPSVGAHLL